MGANDAREQLEVCKDEYGKLERENAELKRENAGLLAQLATSPTITVQGGPPSALIQSLMTEEAFQREAWRRGMR